MGRNQMKTFEKWPSAGVVMGHMDHMMCLIGYSPNNGKGWAGYYDVHGVQQKAMKNRSWQEARTLCTTVFDTVCMPMGRLVNGVKISTGSMMDLDVYIRNHIKEVDLVRQLVYHKKAKKLSLIGYNEINL